MEVSQIWILNIEVVLLQVVAELHGGVGAEGTFWTVVHLHALMFAGVEDVLPDVLRTVGSVAAVKTGSGINMTSVRARTHTQAALWSSWSSHVWSLKTFFPQIRFNETGHEPPRGFYQNNVLHKGLHTSHFYSPSCAQAYVGISFPCSALWWNASKSRRTM